MPREKPRSSEEIDTELDTWLEQRADLERNLSGLTASFESLRNLIPRDGRFPLPEEHTTKLSETSQLLAETRSQLTQANEAITELRSQLAGLQNQPPRPGGGPSPPPPSDPPAPRQTRTGLNFL